MNRTAKPGEVLKSDAVAIESYRLTETTTETVEDYTFRVNSYQPVSATSDVADRLLPLVVQKLSHTLAKQKAEMLPSV